MMVMMFMVMVMIVASASAVWAVVMIVMIVVMIMMVMMVVIVVVMVVVMMIVVVVMIVVVMIMVVVTAVVMIVVVIMLLHQMLHLLFHDQILMLHSCQDLIAFQLIPRSGDNGSLRILLTQHSHACIQLVLRHFLSTADHDGSCVLHLIVKELTEVLHIHLAFLSVYNGNRAVQFYLLMCSNAHNCFGYVRQLADT